MKAKLSLATILLLSIFISCNRNNKQKNDIVDLQLATIKNSPPQTFTKAKEQKIPVRASQQETADSTPASPKPIQSKANIDWDKKIIKTAALKLEVKDFKNYNNNIYKIVKQFGGYIAQEEQNTSEEQLLTVITIKVPVEQFENMMNQLPDSDSKIVERKITTEDVTSEVVDTKSRLEAKKEMRIKYLEFLEQSKNMEEVLQVQNEINSIQEEIESAAGRVQFLSHQASYSTISLTFFQPLAGYNPTEKEPSFLTRISHAFKTGASWVTDLFVAIISIWPILLIIIAVYFGVKKFNPTKKIANLNQ